MTIGTLAYRITRLLPVAKVGRYSRFLVAEYRKRQTVLWGRGAQVGSWYITHAGLFLHVPLLRCQEHGENDTVSIVVRNT